jgi:antitoxin component YwqK of YwqJK toxin-antitoxin module
MKQFFLLGICLLLKISIFAQVSVTCNKAELINDSFHNKETQKLYTGFVTCFYKNGAKESEGETKEGKKQGRWISYWVEGGKKDEQNFINGIAEGAFVTYFKEGSISSRGSYANGYLSGLYESYYYNGKVERKCIYVNGIIHGKIYTYNDNGILIQEQFFKYGEEEGMQYTFNDSGVKIMEIGYKDGDELKDGKYALWNGDGVQVCRGRYKMGKKIGVWKTWSAKGELNSISKYDRNGNLKSLRN